MLNQKYQKSQMIELTKLDRKPILLNLDVVKYIEEIPDTLVIFMNGDSVLVKESLAEIQEKTATFLTKINSSNNSELSLS